MLVATFNVNSIRARKARFLAFLERTSPDVVCLQELKAVDAEFPLEAVRALGYDAAVHGQKTYNGVALVSRAPIADVSVGLGDEALDAQARYVSATIGGVRIASVYVPNGGEVGSDKWTMKLAFYEALRARVRRERDAGLPYALLGDFNVAPFDDDVARPNEWGDTVLCHPEARAGLDRLMQDGLVDAFRPFHPDGGVYSWWDYRGMGFERGNGLRIDHVLVDATLAAKVVGASVDRKERAGEAASDHAPVLVRWDETA